MPFRMNDRQEAVRLGMAESNESVLSNRMIRVWEGDREGITEYSSRFVEGDAVFLAVSIGLVFAPFKFHALFYHSIYYFSLG